VPRRGASVVGVVHGLRSRALDAMSPGMFKNILCPLDFSPSSQHAMKVAVRLANDAGAKLVLTHSWHLPALAFSAEAPYPAGQIELMVSEEEKALAAAVKEARELGAKQVSCTFLSGLPSERICAALGADAFDLVIMGTHGRTGFRRILLGSVTEQVIRHAPCSILAVRGREGSSTFRHILCPVDFSPSSRHAVDLAIELAARDGLGIVLLHVLDLPVAYVGEPSSHAVVADLDRGSTRMLDELAAEVRTKTSVPVVTRTRIGSPAAQTLTVLDSEDTFDLVVVGSHGRTGISRVLLGSVAEKLARHAPCPVLVARTTPPSA
jgi:nucleotide-binding universal stress UspA family protein